MTHMYHASLISLILLLVVVDITHDMHNLFREHLVQTVCEMFIFSTYLGKVVMRWIAPVVALAHLQEKTHGLAEYICGHQAVP